MKRYAPWLIGALLAAGFAVLLANSVTIVGREKVAAQVKAETFDPAAWVEGVWESKLVPTMQDKGVDLATVLAAFEVGETGTGAKAQLLTVAKQYGSVTVGEAHVYMVKTVGTVSEVAPDAITLKIDGYDGPIAVRVYFGTRIPSDETAVRDSVGFISFGDFKEQTQYGQVANEINKRVVKDVISKVDKTALQGKKVAITGAFGMRTFNLVTIPLKEVEIVPVAVSVQG